MISNTANTVNVFSHILHIAFRLFLILREVYHTIAKHNNNNIQIFSLKKGKYAVKPNIPNEIPKQPAVT